MFSSLMLSPPKTPLLKRELGTAAQPASRGPGGRLSFASAARTPLWPPNAPAADCDSRGGGGGDSSSDSESMPLDSPERSAQHARPPSRAAVGIKREPAEACKENRPARPVNGLGSGTSAAAPRAGSASAACLHTRAEEIDVSDFEISDDESDAGADEVARAPAPPPLRPGGSASAANGWVCRPMQTAEDADALRKLEADALSRKRVTLWDPETKKMIKGFAAPMQKNVEQYLRKHPNLVVYNSGQAQAAKPTHSGRSAPR